MSENRTTTAPNDANNKERQEANRLGLDYRSAAMRKQRVPIIDIHSHVHLASSTGRFFEAADAYGISTIFSMSPLNEVAELRRRFGNRLEFIAIPDWKRFDDNRTHRDAWIRDLSAFRECGARICKFWMAPPMRQRHGLTVDHEFLRPVVDAAVELGYQFMIHAGDPSVWWRAGARYADTAQFGTKRAQYTQVEWLLDYVAPRFVIGAHMGGTVEDLPFLQGLLDRHANYVIDTSATKWIVREVARQPEAVREFVLRNSERVLFGSDLVVSEKFQTFEHYASRYWAQRTMWESSYRGESPIDDPDAEGAPQLAGVNLDDEALDRVYSRNARRLLGQ